MKDEKKNISPDDEYQFPQDEYISYGDEHHAFGVDPSMESEGHVADTAESKQKKGKMDWLGLVKDKVKAIKNKRMVLIAVGVVVLLFLFHLFSGVKTESLPPISAQTQTVDTTPVTPPVVTAPPQQPSDSGMMNSLDSLREHSSRTSSDIRQLQGQITDLQNALQQSQTSNQQLQKTVEALTGQMNALAASVNQLAMNARASSKGEKPIVYHLRAVLPDRAWITASTGETMSVTVGDRIDQYGTVNLIDPVHGFVQTSSGKKIEYGPNDY